MDVGRRAKTCDVVCEAADTAKAAHGGVGSHTGTPAVRRVESVLAHNATIAAVGGFQLCCVLVRGLEVQRALRYMCHGSEGRGQIHSQNFSSFFGAGRGTYYRRAQRGKVRSFEPRMNADERGLEGVLFMSVCQASVGAKFRSSD